MALVKVDATPVNHVANMHDAVNVVAIGYPAQEREVAFAHSGAMCIAYDKYAGH
jgi:hypothetical protein